MYAQVQLLYNPAIDKYFVADQVFVKWIPNPNNSLEQIIADIIVVENKLQGTTALTTNQMAGRRAASLNVRNRGLGALSAAPQRPGGTVAPLLDQDQIGLNPSAWYKIFDSEAGDVITGVTNIP